MAKLYVKKPVQVEAICFDVKKPNQLFDFVKSDNVGYDGEREMYFIRTLEGDMYITNGDYVIRGVNGEYYPCKADIFEKTYDEVTE